MIILKLNKGFNNMEYLTRCKNCNHKEDQTQVIEFTYDDEIDYIITCDNCGRDTNILLNN